MKQKIETPWGRAQQRTILLFDEELNPVVINVSTASHGGVGVASAYAHKHLSKAAVERGDGYCGYVWFEEDCRWAIPLNELPQLWDAFFRDSAFFATEKSRREIIDQTNRQWNKGYLEAKEMTNAR